MIKNNDLDKIYGGTISITGSIITAFVNIIRVLMDSGNALGSAIRRIGEDNICPLK